MKNALAGLVVGSVAGNTSLVQVKGIRIERHLLGDVVGTAWNTERHRSRVHRRRADWTYVDKLLDRTLGVLLDAIGLLHSTKLGQNDPAECQHDVPLYSVPSMNGTFTHVHKFLGADELFNPRATQSVALPGSGEIVKFDPCTVMQNCELSKQRSFTLSSSHCFPLLHGLLVLVHGKSNAVATFPRTHASLLTQNPDRPLVISRDSNNLNVGVGHVSSKTNDTPVSAFDAARWHGLAGFVTKWML